ncbi:MAG TPA: amidohydrolase family protein [Pseudonocardiaceae bacterium]|jgi:imidazolonepropionase-like amidohydrolase|nr:amidohydrolase family protein [Pseudonocardiaceae bacterium]
MVESTGSRLQGERVLVTGAALADGNSDSVVRDVTLYVDHGVVAGLWTDGDRPVPGDVADVPVIDGLGSTIVPGMVDSHSHLSMPGGADWVAHGFDPLDTLLAVGEENGELMVRAGIRWARDVGAPRRLDPDRGAERAASLMLRERWQGNRDRPYIRAAGTWLLRPGALPEGLGIEVAHGADLAAAVRQQLDEGADLVKLYLDGPDPDVSPFSTDEVTAAVREAHNRGAKVAAHATTLPGNRVGAEAGVDSLEHGFQIDADIARIMVANNVTLVSTLAVMHSWRTFAATSTVARFTDPDMGPKLDERLENAAMSVRTADVAGVAIAAGSDFGGGSLRANQLVWEVEAMVAAGIEPRKALAAATWRGGDLLGVPHAGRLAVGLPAHFSLVHGDPLSEPSALWRVWLTR